MTQPTMMMFGRDGNNSAAPYKVFLRFSLFSTCNQSQIVENLYANLKTPKGMQQLSLWVVRPDGETELSRGSGLTVSENGVSGDHHLVTRDESFEFVAGDYTITLIAKLVNRRNLVGLGS